MSSQEYISSLSLEDAEHAYDNAVRNLHFTDICSIEHDPRIDERDSEHIKYCKSLWQHLCACHNRARRAA